jgi:hypothetical protein
VRKLRAGESSKYKLSSWTTNQSYLPQKFTQRSSLQKHKKRKSCPMLKPKAKVQITAEEMARIAAIAKAQYNKLNGAFFKKSREKERIYAKTEEMLKRNIDSEDDDFRQPMIEEVCVDADDLMEKEVEKVKSEFIGVVIKKEPVDEFECEATVKFEHTNDVKDEPMLLIEVPQPEIADRKLGDVSVLLTRLEPEEIMRWTKVKQEPELEALLSMLGDESDHYASSEDYFLTSSSPPAAKKRAYRMTKKRVRKDNHTVKYGANAVFSCDLCPRKFMTRKTIFEHLRNHHLTAKFPCQECEKTFHNSGNCQLLKPLKKVSC